MAPAQASRTREKAGFALKSNNYPLDARNMSHSTGRNHA
jgi:hypothetical protein